MEFPKKPFLRDVLLLLMVTQKRSVWTGPKVSRNIPLNIFGNDTLSLLGRAWPRNCSGNYGKYLMIHRNGSNSCQNQCAKQQCFVALEKYSITCQLLYLHLNNIVVKHTCKKRDSGRRQLAPRIQNEIDGHGLWPGHSKYIKIITWCS